MIRTSLVCRMFANGPGDRGSIPCRVTPKTQKMFANGPGDRGSIHVESHQRLKKCSPMARETGVQSHVESHQRLKKCSPIAREIGVQSMSSHTKDSKNVHQWPWRPGFNPRSSQTKMVLDTALLNTQHCKVRIKWSNPGKGVASSHTHRCRS